LQLLYFLLLPIDDKIRRFTRRIEELANAAASLGPAQLNELGARPLPSYARYVFAPFTVIWSTVHHLNNDILKKNHENKILKIAKK
jgi:hypothetical protein